MKRAYLLALICGAVPLLVGASIFLLWLNTRWDWLMVAGGLTIWGGIVIFLIGVFALARYWRLASRSPDLSRWRLWLSTLICAGLLLLNFPVAGVILNTVISIETAYTVVVHNATQQPLNSVRVFGGGCDVLLGTIPPGGRVQQTIWFQHDGTLVFSALSGTAVRTETIEGYVTPGMPGHTTVTLNPDGAISIIHRGAF